MFTSCCPGWVKFVEFYYPEFISHLTTTRSPEIISGFLTKTYWADLVRKNPEDIIVVSIMPCTAKKREITLAEHRLTRGQGKNAISFPAVDYVLTTREYAYLLKKHRIDLKKIKPEKMDNPLGVESGAAVIYGASGGVMESALRTADYFLRIKKETGNLAPVIAGQNYQLKKYKFSSLAQSRLEFREARGLKGVKEALVTIAGIKLKVAVVNGLGHARAILEKIKNGQARYDYVEVMACPGGCIGGGGQPVPVSETIRQKRAAALYSLDEKSVIRTAHENLSLLSVYQNYLQGNEEKMEELFHSRHSFNGRGGYKQV
jgi:iron only hydrogenase large subunit-like protein